MTFNELKIGMFVGSVLYKEDPSHYTLYTIREILRIDGSNAKCREVQYGKNNNKFAILSDEIVIKGSTDFGLTNKFNDIIEEDKFDFVKSIFEGVQLWKQ